MQGDATFSHRFASSPRSNGLKRPVISGCAAAAEEVPTNEAEKAAAAEEEEEERQVATTLLDWDIFLYQNNLWGH